MITPQEMLERFAGRSDGGDACAWTRAGQAVDGPWALLRRDIGFCTNMLSPKGWQPLIESGELDPGFLVEYAWYVVAHSGANTARDLAAVLRAHGLADRVAAALEALDEQAPSFANEIRRSL